MLLFWTRMITHSVDEAKKTIDGLPTELAILARWWIADFQPRETEKDDWERSFACACQWMDKNVVSFRKQLLQEIDQTLMDRFVEQMRVAVYTRRAAVLSCAGVPTAIARQFVLPLVSAASYDEVAGLETMDFFPEDVEGYQLDRPAKTASKTAARACGCSGKRG